MISPQSLNHTQMSSVQIMSRLNWLNLVFLQSFQSFVTFTIFHFKIQTFSLFLENCLGLPTEQTSNLDPQWFPHYLTSIQSFKTPGTPSSVPSIKTPQTTLSNLASASTILPNLCSSKSLHHWYSLTHNPCPPRFL